MADTKMDDTQQKRESLLEGIASTLGVLAVGLFVLTFIFQNFMIPSSSMASTLLVGDHVMVERTSLAPTARWAPLPYRAVKRGDIIVFYKPTVELGAAPDSTHKTLVKRVVGIPGDRIHLRNGVLYLNGVAQNEPFAAKPSYATYDSYVDDFPVMDPATHLGITPEWAAQLSSYVHDGDLVVPPGKYFAMGDNRDRSMDSRYWGFVPRENILGRPLFVYWSIESPETDDDAPVSQQVASKLHEMLHFFDQTRWTRTFHLIQ